MNTASSRRLVRPRLVSAARRALTALVLAFLAACALLAAGVAPFGGGPAGAVSGNAGPVAITVTPTSGVSDGQAVSIHAEVPSGTVIYELKAHVCLPNANVRSNFDFGFQGKKCTNAPVGAGDVEQTASFGEGVQAGDLEGFKVGSGSTMWVNELGYNVPIACGPAQQCDLVVRAQITNGTVFFTVPLCYGADCANADAPPPAPATDPPAPAAPAAAATDSSASSGGAGSATGGGAASGPTSAAGGVAAAGKAATSGKSPAGKGAGKGAAANSGGTVNGDRELASATTTAATSASDLSRGWRVLIAAVAGALAAADIARVVMRTRRRRSMELGTT